MKITKLRLLTIMATMAAGSASAFMPERTKHYGKFGEAPTPPKCYDALKNTKSYDLNVYCTPHTDCNCLSDDSCNVLYTTKYPPIPLEINGVNKAEPTGTFYYCDNYVLHKDPLKCNLNINPSKPSELLLQGPCVGGTDTKTVRCVLNNGSDTTTLGKWGPLNTGGDQGYSCGPTTA